MFVKFQIEEAPPQFSIDRFSRPSFDPCPCVDALKRIPVLAPCRNEYQEAVPDLLYQREMGESEQRDWMAPPVKVAAHERAHRGRAPSRSGGHGKLRHVIQRRLI